MKDDPMADDLFQTSNPEALAELMRLGTGRVPLWQPDERERLITEQLAAAPTDGPVGDGPSLGQLLTSKNPPLDLLHAAAAHFGDMLRSEEAPLPVEIARALHGAAVAALVIGDNRPAGMDDETLGAELRWILAQPWVDDPVRSVCRAAIRRLGP